jgi:5-methylcytosine-specific restriction enzyme subunit McrC
MRQINLREWERKDDVALAVAERDALIALRVEDGQTDRQARVITVEPVVGTQDRYNLRPNSIIGAVEIGDLSVLIKPKIEIRQVLALACYGIGNGAVKFQTDDFGFDQEDALHDFLAIALAFQARKAFARGLLHGYRTEEEALYTVRGRIRFDDQLRRRFGVPLPVEVRYDEFTIDVLANQLVKAAVYRLRRARLRSSKARRDLGWVASMLDDVSLCECSPKDVPSVRYDRLNEHYRGVVELSRLILRHGAFESGRGEIRASGFLMDMNVVFQEFVAVALRDELRASPNAFGEKYIDSLDKGNDIHLRPDLTWFEGNRCVFVGDAKYKRIAYDRIPNADLCQLLAYTIAEDLPGGLLIYAEDDTESGDREYTVRHAEKRLEVAALDLSGTLDETLARVKGLSRKVLALRVGQR